MNTLHGWFLMSAYDKTDPYGNSSYNDSVYCGIVTTFLYLQTKFDNN